MNVRYHENHATLTSTGIASLWTAPVLGSVEVSALYWNHAQSALRTDLSGFFDDIVRSPFVDQLSEYSTGGSAGQIGHGRFVGSYDFVPQGTLASATLLSDADIQTEIRALVSNGILTPGQQSLAIIFLPTGVAAVPPGGSAPFEGYHYAVHFPRGAVYYAVIRDAAGAVDRAQFDSTFDYLTAIASHELAEAITDPDPYERAWFDDSLGEVADICSWKYPEVRVDGYLVERVWSQKRQACMAVPGPVDATQPNLASCWSSRARKMLCVDMHSDKSNCGACGNACGGDDLCLTGSCQSIHCSHPAGSGGALVSGAVTQQFNFPLPILVVSGEFSFSFASSNSLGYGSISNVRPSVGQYADSNSLGYIQCYSRPSADPAVLSLDIWDAVSGQYGSFSLTITCSKYQGYGTWYEVSGSLHAECLPTRKWTTGATGTVDLDLTF